MGLKRFFFFLFILLASLAPTLSRATGPFFNNLEQDDANQLDGYMGYGVEMPSGLSAGVGYGALRAGISIPPLRGSSMIYTLGVEGRSIRHVVSPVIGINFNWLNVKPGEVHTSGFEEGRNGFLLTFNLGAGIRLNPDYYFDVGVFYQRQISVWTPYLLFSFPITAK